MASVSEIKYALKLAAGRAGTEAKKLGLLPSSILDPLNQIDGINIDTDEKTKQLKFSVDPKLAKMIEISDIQRLVPGYKAEMSMMKDLYAGQGMSTKELHGELRAIYEFNDMTDDLWEEYHEAKDAGTVDDWADFNESKYMSSLRQEGKYYSKHNMLFSDTSYKAAVKAMKKIRTELAEIKEHGDKVKRRRYAEISGEDLF